MSRKENRMKEALLKRILKKGNVPEEKKEEMRAAISALDINTIVSNPCILKELMGDPSKLSNYVKESDEATEASSQN